MINKKFKNEKEFSSWIFEQFSLGLKKILIKYDLKIAENKKILKDVTILPKNKNYELTLGFSDNDIVIYRELDSDLVGDLKKIKGINLSSVRGEGRLIIPFVIVELKLENVVSHSFLVYSHTAMEIKDKFPYCMFNFLVWSSNKMDVTLLRQGKNFDNILILNKERGKELIPKDSLKDLIKSIEHHLDKLSGDGII